MRQKKLSSTPVGFEPTRSESTELAVLRLNHSAKVPADVGGRIKVKIDSIQRQKDTKTEKKKKNKRIKKQFQALHGFEPWFQESESCVLTAAL